MTKAEKKIRFVREILPKLPEYVIWEDSRRYKLMIAQGEIWFKCRDIILKRFKRPCNYDAGIVALDWLERNRGRWKC